VEQEPHVSEYHDSMVALLEWIWGRDYMAPGGEGNVDKMVEGIVLVVCEKGELRQGYTRGRKPLTS
jgi:hypothetical protein